MHLLRRLALTIAVIGLGGGANLFDLRAADTLQMDTVTTVDRLGDGEMTITFRLSASQWTAWKQQYGDRPDVLWRDLRQQFAAYQLDKFALEKNDVERTATARITMRAAAGVRSDGSRQLDVPKEMKTIKEGGREWIFNAVSQETPYAPIVNQTIRLVLPEEAQNIRLHQPGTAFQALVYELPATASGGSGLLYGGIVALVMGVVLSVVGFLPRKAPAAQPA